MEIRNMICVRATRMPPANHIAFSKDLSENRDRYMAQSILTGVVHNPEVPSIDEARDILAWAGRVM